MMIKIKRWYHDDCTIGRLRLYDFQCFTLELANLNNQKNISCIPEGVYNYLFKMSKKNGAVLELSDVKDRTNIQMHAGNYTRQTLGCILVGDGIKWLDKDGIPDVTNSVKTLNKLLELSGATGEIEIT